MKFDCGLTYREKDALDQERKKKLATYRKWFAWYPVKVADHDCRWFETVERRRVSYTKYGYLYLYRHSEYREVQDEKTTQ